MKAKMIYFSMLIMAMFITSACSNEDDFSDIMNSNNLLTENIEIFEIERKNTTVQWPDNTAIPFNCYETKSELNGLYTIDDMDLLNWNNRTLVMVDIFYPCSMFDFTKKVYEKDGKYVIELLEVENSGLRDLGTDHKCYGILLDKANVKAKDIQLKVGIYMNAGTDSEGNRHKEHYKYLK